MTAITTTPAYKVADIGLAAYGRKEIQLAEHEMPGPDVHARASSPARSR